MYLFGTAFVVSCHRYAVLIHFLIYRGFRSHDARFTHG